MNNNWEISTLDQLAEVIDSRHKTPKYSNEGLPMVRVVDVTGGKLELSNTNKVSQDIYDDFSKGRDPKIGDLIISRVGSYGNISYVNSKDKFCLGQNTALIVPKGINWRYLYYQLISPLIKNQIEFLVVGAVQKTISLKSIKSFELMSPPLPEQKAIAHILGTLDDKIELNRKMNQTLEAMARALFKSWFVDFDPVMDNALAAGNDIPEELQIMADKRALVPHSKKLISKSPELAKEFSSSFAYNETLGKWIPEGWEVKSIDQFINLIGGGTPKTLIEEYWNGIIPWFSVVDAPSDTDVFVIKTEKTITEIGVKNSSTKVLDKWTTIISARGTVGKCAIVGVPMAMNQSCYGVKSKFPNQDIYTYLLLRKNVSDLQNKSHGSVFSTITRGTFSAIPIASPKGYSLQESFEKQIFPLFEKIKSNLFETETLTQLRDRLLPELISGRVKVGEKILNLNL